ncbi:Ubiquitin carboxyl-terminal hydrolase, putative isoform 2 [Hibiscus syriacus]|uniref:Ubiquitin carboxyl-terminal hydrolase, putative isoform 2 n=1 Tax=Hibiscus syriacus TaxID=106335 RepID=A0A6A3AQL3_HIBSY|nr:Ubiquitin carboxyl-terminal hydrolase, putative isoform 2 [Hibiscus syriacus]
MRWTAAFGFHLSVVGLVGVVDIILAVIRDDKLREKRKKHLVPGLQNLGNNCFLNVILLAMASCSYFQPFLQKILEECESTLVEGQCESLPLTVTLSDLLEAVSPMISLVEDQKYMFDLVNLLRDCIRCGHRSMSYIYSNFAELGMAGERRVALSPHKVMCALALYIQNFDLTNQQDAAEAFLHLLSSLREEFSIVYLSSQSTLADIFASQICRILTPERKEDRNEQKRWQQHYLGPFDGIIGSILTCQSCSYQVLIPLYNAS